MPANKRPRVKQEDVSENPTSSHDNAPTEQNDDHGILGGRRIAPPAVRLKAERILEVLNRLYPDPPVPLNHSNDFTFLVAVVLSAQTTDGKVNDVTKELFQRADTPQKMMQLPVAEVQRIIQSVGLAPKKAQYVVGLSKKLVEDFGGVVPSTFEALESLPGVGHKTASVIRSQCFGFASFAVDTHVHRLALRWGLSKEQRNVDKVQADLCAAFPEDSWNKVSPARRVPRLSFHEAVCTGAPADDLLRSRVLPREGPHRTSSPAPFPRRLTHADCVALMQPAQCPVCSWVNSAGRTLRTPPADLTSFSPQKKAKGLVYYGDRRDELEGDPSLAVYSSPSPDKRSVLQDVAKVFGSKAEAGALVLDFAEAKETDGDPTATTPSTEAELAEQPLVGRKRSFGRASSAAETSAAVAISGASARRRR